ncbi:MAG: polysaccharide biosynthesis tyrosine autokinase [Clostridia bacterium]|nr:polysaccharide biosynthesis tyrosine autokinase [Clostridia bacterium]
MEEEIDLKEIFNIFWRKKIIIILVTILFSAIGVYYTYNYTVPEYKSSTTLLLAQNYSSDIENETNEITQTDITLNQKLVSTYSVLVKSKSVLNQVLQNLNMNYDLEEELKQNIEVKAVENTQVIEITYKNEDANTAYLVANELSNVFCEKVVEIYNINNVYIVDHAELAESPYNINHIKDILLFAFVGIFVSSMFVFICSLFDTTVKNANDIEKNTNLTSLSELPEFKMKKEIITYEDPKSPISEAFKTLRTNLQFMGNKEESMSLLVTSTMPGEGKSLITSNLAVAFAQSDKKTVIIDSDMRKGRLHNIFETKIFPGLSNYLADKDSKISDYLIKTHVDNLWILPAGNVPPNPSELLSSEKLIEGLEDLKKSFDVVIFDSTPCMLVTDALIISRMVDLTVVVTCHKKTKTENLKNIQKNIDNVGGKIAGVIVNKIPVSTKKYKSKYYYYGDKK